MQHNYRVAGKKMESRFGLSHKDARALAKSEAMFYQQCPAAQRTLKYATKRLAKKCMHLHMIDTSHGGPESGTMSGFCKDCGWSYRHALY